MPGLKPSKRSKSPPSSAGKRYPNKPNTRHSRHAQATTRPQQRLKGTPRPQQWLLIGVQGCRLPGLKPSKRSKSPPSSHAPRPHATATTRPQQWLKGTHTAAALASYRRSSLPFARPQTLQTLQTSAQLRREKVPQQSQHAPLPHAKATTRPQQWLKGTPPAAAMAIRASYRRSRLPFAGPQTLQTLQTSAQLRRDKVPQQAQHAPLPHAQATARPQQWLKGSPRPQQWLLMGVQGCRLPGLKPSKRSKSPPSSAEKRYPNKPNTRHSRTHKPPQGHSNGSRAPPGRSNGFL